MRTSLQDEVRPGSTCRSPLGALCVPGGRQAEKESSSTPSKAPGPLHVYERAHEWRPDSSLEEQFFTESLILAQDERWRRA